MPAHLDPKVTHDAEAAIENAKRVRAAHARRSRRGSPRREQDINIALDRLKTAMKPLRSEIGRFPYGPDTEKAEQNRKIITDLSGDIQKERRKLWKMQKHG
jgi:hypothetical protein